MVLAYRLSDVYQSLGRWLWEKTDTLIEAWYNELGESVAITLH